mmetsp:Transcript_122754/g.354840  ORF Transcript_122754/g.354840 Transcript_122754/m.354840 type:complete len:280 (-) Transcript_122754:40-879(-)
MLQLPPVTSDHWLLGAGEAASLVATPGVAAGRPSAPSAICSGARHCLAAVHSGDAVPLPPDGPSFRTTPSAAGCMKPQTTTGTEASSARPSAAARGAVPLVPPVLLGCRDSRPSCCGLPVGLCPAAQAGESCPSAQASADAVGFWASAAGVRPVRAREQATFRARRSSFCEDSCCSKANTFGVHGPVGPRCACPASSLALPWAIAACTAAAPASPVAPMASKASRANVVAESWSSMHRINSKGLCFNSSNTPGDGCGTAMRAGTLRMSTSGAVVAAEPV